MGRKAPAHGLNRTTLLVAAFAAAVVTPAIARAADSSRALAERYSPVLRLVEQEDPCKHGEPFVPRT
jgi:hypothetical protein